MFEKLTQAAERAAIGVSRRQFLRRLGQGSLIAAAGLGSLLASPAVALAGRRACDPGFVRVSCHYRGYRLCCPYGLVCRCYATNPGVYCQCELP
jgi:hypothetical protein